MAGGGLSGSGARWRAVLAAAIIAAATVGVTAPDVVASSSTSAVETYLDYDRPAHYSTAESTVYVPTRDGTKIACELRRPATKGTTTPASGQFPGLVVDYSPYFLLSVVPPNMPGTLGTADLEYWSERGYVTLMCWTRGTGLSEGVWEGWLTEQENLDNYDVIEWLAQQPYTNGKIGQTGTSYGGMTSYRVAQLRPPHLVAIAPLQAHSSVYQNWSYPGGIRSTGEPSWFVGGAMGVGGGRPVPYPQMVDWLQHPNLDDYWSQIDIEPHLDQIAVPVLAVGGWLDLFQDGMPRNYIGLKSRSFLIDGPWTHAPLELLNLRGMRLAWFDRHLLGLESAPKPPAKVISYQMPNGPWRELRDWPAPSARPRAWSFNRSGELGPAGSPATVGYVADGVPAATPPQGGVDAVTFSSAPNDDDVVIAGAGHVDLLATLSRPSGTLSQLPGDGVDTNFVVTLYDVAPDGTQTYVTKGYLKASHRLSHTDPTMVELDVPNWYRVPLWHTHWSVAKGHRLMLQLASADSTTPAALQPIPPLQVDIAVGGAGSSVTLPVE